MQLRLLIISTLLGLFGPQALPAFEGRLLLEGSRPLGNAEVTIIGRPGGVRTDASGRFTVEPDPQLPATVLVIGPRGEIYEPVELTSLAPQEITLRAVAAESITVSSGVAPNILAPPGAATSLIGREELEERQPEHLVDALERIAGVAKRGEGPAAVPVVRGLAGGRTLILLDDGRVTAERRAGASATFLNPFTLGSVEVARGPGSVSYGSDAFGGVVHARPRDPVPGARRLHYEFSAAVGASDMLTGGIEWNQELFGGAILASIYGRSSEGTEAASGEEILNSAYDDKGMMIRFVRDVAKGTLRLGLQADRGGEIQAPSADAREQRTYYPEEDSTRLSGSWHGTQIGLFDTLEVRGALSTYDIATNRERIATSTVTRRISNSDVTADDASLRVTASRGVGNGRLSGGVDISSRFNLHATGFTENFNEAGTLVSRTFEVSVENASKVDSGIFATYDTMLSQRLAASGGVRVGYITTRNRGGFVGDRSNTETPLSGHFALTFTPVSSLTLAAQIASGYREPTLSDRYFRGVSGRGFVIGNPDLEPERSLQLDASARWQRGRNTFGLSLYDYTITDLIERYRAARDFRFRNRGEASIRGIELEAAVPVATSLLFTATATVARGEAVDDDQPLDDIPGPNAHVGVRWGEDKLYAFLHSFWYAEDDRPGPVETERPSYTTFDLGAGYRMYQGLELRLQARNILNQEYAGSPDENAAQAPGRSVTLFVAGTM